MFASYAAAWLEWMAAMSWQVAVLFFIAWSVARAAFRSSASFRHLIWLVVFLKLVMPPWLSAPWSAGTVLSQVPLEVRVEAPTLPSTASTPTLSPAPPAFPQDTATVKTVATWPSILMIAWALPAAGLFLSIAWQWRRFRAGLRGSLEAAPSAIEKLAAAEAARLGLARVPRICCSSRVSTPAVIGLWRPMVLLPLEGFGHLGEGELRLVLAHELAHIKRKDLAIGWLTAGLCCVYWFHPLVWLAHLQLRREREMACDDVVLKKSGDTGDEYASTLVKVASSYRGGVPAGAGLIGLIEIADNLLQRVRSANDGRRRRSMGWKSAVSCCALLLLLPMAVWTAAPEPTKDVEEEIALYYADADAEVVEYVRWTAANFSRGGLWLPENAFDDLSAEEREAKIAHYAEALQGEYGRHLCTAVVEAGVLKDPRLYPGVLKVATYHRDDADYDCRPKWMAVEALGRLGNEEAVPQLIPLVDHGNQNTRMWARASLVRLTDQHFGADKQAWGRWWNGTGRSPQLSEADLKPWQPIEPAGQEPSASAKAPEIVTVTPAIGAGDVDPATSEIRVTFDQDMRGGFSWTGGGEVYPELSGKPQWIDKRTCALPVKLEAGRFYRVGINSTSHQNFRGENGVPARVRTLYFATTGADAATLARLEPPQVVSLDPPNGADAVDAATKSMTVTFDKPMGGGFSWVTIDEHYPPTTGGASWDSTNTVCTLPVKLVPGTTYRLSLNAPGYANFNSESGVPLEPVVWEFTTAN